MPLRFGPLSPVVELACISHRLTAEVAEEAESITANVKTVLYVARNAV